MRRLYKKKRFETRTVLHYRNVLRRLFVFIQYVWSISASSHPNMFVHTKHCVPAMFGPYARDAVHYQTMPCIQQRGYRHLDENFTCNAFKK